MSTRWQSRPWYFHLRLAWEVNWRQFDSQHALGMWVPIYHLRRSTNCTKIGFPTDGLRTTAIYRETLCPIDTSALGLKWQKKHLYRSRLKCQLEGHLIRNPFGPNLCNLDFKFRKFWELSKSRSFQKNLLLAKFDTSKTTKLRYVVFENSTPTFQITWCLPYPFIMNMLTRTRINV